jgi:uncharacterized peroxidase-related enzyme
MAHVPLVEGDGGPELAEVFAAARARFGFVPDVVRALALRPDVAAAQGALRDTLMGDASSVGARRADLIALAVSSINHCEYCGTAHAGVLARRGDLTEDEAVAMFEDWRSVDLPEADRAMLTFAEKLTFDPGRVGENDVAELRAAGFGELEIYDIVLLTAYRNFINRVNDGLGVPLDRLRERFGDALVDGTTGG